MKRAVLMTFAVLAFALVAPAYAQSVPGACATPAVLPTVPSNTAQVASFTGQWFPTGGQNETFSATLWREACPSNPATSILYVRYTPTFGTPLICEVNYSL